MQQPKNQDPNHQHSKISSSTNVPSAPPYDEHQMARNHPPLHDPIFPPNHNFTASPPDHSHNPNPPNSTVYGFPYSLDHPTTLGSFTPHIRLNSCVINITVGDQRLVSRLVGDNSSNQRRPHVLGSDLNGKGRLDNDQIPQQQGLDASCGYGSLDEPFAWPASSKRIVLKLDIHDGKTKQKVLKRVSRLIGIHEIDVNMGEKKLTVIGDVDAVEIVKKLRKICHAELLIYEPANEPERKDETCGKINEEDKRVAAKEEPKSKRVAGEKKDEPKIKERDEQIAELVKACKAYNYPATGYSYYVHAAEENNPNSCVIC